MENNAKCAICGTSYHKCNSCPDSKLKPWLSIVDTINHFKIYTIIADYTNKKIDKHIAKELLDKCDISDYKQFVPEISSVVESIIAQDVKRTKKSTRKEIISVDETENE